MGLLLLLLLLLLLSLLLSLLLLLLLYYRYTSTAALLASIAAAVLVEVLRILFKMCVGLVGANDGPRLPASAWGTAVLRAGEVPVQYLLFLLVGSSLKKK